MSAPNNNTGQGSSQPSSSSSSSPPHVVQTILESFTRCFAPINECSSPSSNHTMDFGGNCYSSGITGVSSNDSMNSKSRNNITTKVPRTRSSSIATTTNEGGRRSRKSSSSSISRPIPTPEELNERSLKRKLEIFRGSGGQSSSRVQPEAGNTTAATAASTTTTSSSNNLVRQREDNNDSRGQSPHSHQTSTSDDDDDEEEILRLTQNSRRHRFGPPFGGCGLGYLPDSHDDNNNDDCSSSSSITGPEDDDGRT
jgi:hypothetical protein